MARPSVSRALESVTVLDLTRVRAGPTCVRQLADWGANVIKVEMREEDVTASTQSDFSLRHDPDFQNLHRNKRGIALDLKTPGGQAILRRLAERADVAVENFRPDVKKRLSIDYETLCAVNPRLVYASISGFGQDGPYAKRPGVDQIVQGMSGFMSITGEPGRGPMRAGIALADLSAGLFAALGILTALYERERSGKGQWVQTSLLQSQLFMLDFQGARYLMRGEVPGQAGNNHPTGSPTGVFPTRDGYVNLAPTPPMWRRFCEAIGRTDLIEHPDYATNKLRAKNRPALHSEIEAFTREHTSEAMVEKMNQAGIPCGPIYKVDQAFADPQVRHVGIAQTVRSEKLGDITLLGQPFTLSRTPSSLAVSAPEYGEHMIEALREAGFGTVEIPRSGKSDLKASDGHEFSAYFAEPVGRPRGGLVVAQEAFGVNAYVRSVCDRFAAEGYACLAPALYDRQERNAAFDSHEPDVLAHARKLRAGLVWSDVLNDVGACVEKMREFGRVGVVGYCVGGSVAWLAALELDVAAASCYYGRDVVGWLDRKPRCPAILHFGETDHLIPMSDVERIRRALPDTPVYVYPAGHAFDRERESEPARLAHRRTLELFERTIARGV